MKILLKKVQLILKGHILFPATLSLNTQQEMIKKWLEKNIYKIEHWDPLVQKQIRVRSIEVMEKGAFQLANINNDSDKMRVLKEWIIEKYQFSEILKKRTRADK